MKHAPQIWIGKKLYNHVFDYDGRYNHDFSMIMDEDGNPIDGIDDQFFVVQYPDCCTVCNAIGDATIYGPYESESDALRIHQGAELY